MIEKLQELSRLIDEAKKIYASSASWEVKYSTIFCMDIDEKVKELNLKLFDSDSSDYPSDYKQDITAYMEALHQLQNDLSDVVVPKITSKLKMKGLELKDRFIYRLEYAGFTPYMFAEGLATVDDDFTLTKEQCLALGMSETEFEARKI